MSGGKDTTGISDTTLVVTHADTHAHARYNTHGDDAPAITSSVVGGMEVDAVSDSTGK